MNDKLSSIYGRGWAFPPVFSKSGVLMAEGADDVSQSLNILFNTQRGERFLREDYGCNLSDFVFSNITNTLLSDIERSIYDSILRCEPRVNISSVKVDTSNMRRGILAIKIIYRLSGSDDTHQFSKNIDMANGAY
ncbi:GPW/gp25 family protein [Aeromonas jandaei]|uniref:GPW/gp25 family protein n=1 Tax=Aeromonas jandaei TaxID=650 RepID=UPI003BA0EC67